MSGTEPIALGAFVMVPTRDQRFLWPLGRDMTPAFVAHARPRYHEPREGGPMPPAPPGVDPIRWAYADVRARKRIVRLARG